MLVVMFIVCVGCRGCRPIRRHPPTHPGGGSGGGCRVLVVGQNHSTQQIGRRRGQLQSYYEK